MLEINMCSRENKFMAENAADHLHVCRNQSQLRNIESGIVNRVAKGKYRFALFSYSSLSIICGYSWIPVIKLRGSTAAAFVLT